MDGGWEAGRPVGDRAEFLAGLRLGLRRLNHRIATEAEVYDPSLESIVAAETAVSSFDSGFDGEPLFRGYAVGDLLRESGFPEVAYLLLQGDLPSGEFLADFQSILAESSDLPPAVADLLAALPFNVPPLEAVRTAVTALAHFDPQPDESGRDVAASQAVRLLAKLPHVLAARRAASVGGEIPESDPDAGYAANLLTLLTGVEPDAEAEAAFEAALVVVCEQGLDASTLAARAAISTGGDLFAAITAAVSVWAGPLHGGPRAQILDWIEIAGPGGMTDYLRREIAQGHAFAGFDPRTPPGGDVRTRRLTSHCRRLAAAAGFEELERSAAAAEKHLGTELGLGPTLDWPLTRLLHHLGLDADLFKAVAAIARVAGWSAHAIEQSEHNQLLRPRSRYVGPPQRPFVQLERRG